MEQLTHGLVREHRIWRVCQRRRTATGGCWMRDRVAVSSTFLCWHRLHLFTSQYSRVVVSRVVHLTIYASAGGSPCLHGSLKGARGRVTGRGPGAGLMRFGMGGSGTVNRSLSFDDRAGNIRAKGPLAGFCPSLYGRSGAVRFVSSTPPPPPLCPLFTGTST